jgi:transcriptional regulator with XRE-family HTH domain
MDITLERILELISSKNLSQKDVTDFLGISANSFTNWKSERNTSYKKYRFLNQSNSTMLK